MKRTGPCDCCTCQRLCTVLSVTGTKAERRVHIKSPCCSVEVWMYETNTCYRGAQVSAAVFFQFGKHNERWKDQYHPDKLDICYMKRQPAAIWALHGDQEQGEAAGLHPGNKLLLTNQIWHVNGRNIFLPLRCVHSRLVQPGWTEPCAGSPVGAVHLGWCELRKRFLVRTKQPPSGPPGVGGLRLLVNYCHCVLQNVLQQTNLEQVLVGCHQNQPGSVIR